MIAVAVFCATYVVLALGRLPGFRVDRTGAAIIGASLMVGFDVLSLEEAVQAVNHDTIILLFGMMIVVANLRVAGFFRLAALASVTRAHHPPVLLAVVILTTGVLSALFVNDTICLVMTPLVLEITETLGLNPKPYLLAVATSSNIGSAATIVGNPQNMIIGSHSKIPFTAFAAALAPVAAIGLLLCFAVIAFAYRREIFGRPPCTVPGRKVRVRRPLLWKSLTAAVFMIVFFLAGWPVPKVALAAGAFVLVTRRIKPQRIYREIDFGLLVLFVGLFIVVAGFATTEVAVDLFAWGVDQGLDRVAVLSGLAALLSNLVSNVPAVLVFEPFLRQLEDPTRAWLALAMASTFAGNLTLLGSIANLIVVEQARAHVRIGFGEHFRVGAPLTVLTLIAGILWLA
jgi:Na+/H+ antiporter NhaD/arsenite permease-like protein